MSSLAHVTVTVSGVLPAPVDRVWPLVRDFGNLSKWLSRVGNQRVDSELLVNPSLTASKPSPRVQAAGACARLRGIMRSNRHG